MNNAKCTSFDYDYVMLTPGEQIGMHEQDTFELSLVLLGSGTRTIAGLSEPFGRGDVALIPPGVPHCWHFGDADLDDQGRIHNITVNFRPEFLAATAQLMPELRPALSRLLKLNHAVGFSPAKRATIASKLQTMQETDAAGRLISLLQLLQLMGSAQGEQVIGGLSKREKIKNQWDKLRIYLICNYMHDITLLDAAQHLGMSRSAFCAFFKQEAHTTFVSYLNNMRITQARKMLLEASNQRISVSEVCYRCGFGSVAHFNHLFKAATGLTPTQFRAGACR